jgi:hypothetical protein
MVTVAAERERLQQQLAHVDERLATLAEQSADLEAERAQITFGIDLLNRVEPTGRKPRKVNNGPSTGDLAVKIINASGRQVWRVADMIEALEATGWGDTITGDKANAVRTALNRAADRDHKITRYGSGGYVALNFQEEPAIPSTPAADDPWATPAHAGAGLSEEPPF